MKTTMKLAIETYSNLNNTTFQAVVNQCNEGNQIIIDSVMKLMFCVS
jgi:hypothetical protein